MNRLGVRLSDRAQGLLGVLFILAMVAAVAWFSVEKVQDLPSPERGEAGAFAIAAWGLSLAAGIALNVVHYLRGTLILDDPADREANRRRIQAMNPRGMVLPGVCAALALGAFAPSVKLVVFGLLGGLSLTFAPVLLWISLTRS